MKITESCHPQNQRSSTEPKETGSSFKQDSDPRAGSNIANLRFGVSRRFVKTLRLCRIACFVIIIAMISVKFIFVPSESQKNNY